MLRFPKKTLLGWRGWVSPSADTMGWVWSGLRKLAGRVGFGKVKVTHVCPWSVCLLAVIAHQ